RSISSGQQPPCRTSGERAMTDALFLAIGELAERPAQRRKEEDGIVSKAAVATRSGRNLTFRNTLYRALAAMLVDQRNHAAKPGRALACRNRAQSLQQQARSPSIVEPRPAESRRMQTGRAAERIDLEPRVVAQRRVAGQLSRSSSLDERVLDVGCPRFGRQRRAGKVGEAHELDR